MVDKKISTQAKRSYLTPPLRRVFKTQLLTRDSTKELLDLLLSKELPKVGGIMIEVAYRPNMHTFQLKTRIETTLLRSNSKHTKAIKVTRILEERMSLSRISAELKACRAIVDK